MTEEQRKLATSLGLAARDHLEWLTVIRYGMPTLLGDSAFLLDLICEEAKRRDCEPSLIMSQLGLGFYGPRPP